jgi:hypothetical protein
MSPGLPRKGLRGFLSQDRQLELAIPFMAEEVIPPLGTPAGDRHATALVD